MKAKYLSLLALSALLVSCGPTTSGPTDPTSTPNPGSDPTTSGPTDPTNPGTDPTDPVTPFDGPESVGLIGSFEASAWNVDIPFTPDEAGRIWTISDYPFYKGDSWKARAEAKWDVQWNYSNLDETSAAMFEETGAYGGDILVLESAHYSITINAETNVMSVVKGEVIEDKPFVAPESIGIIGLGGNWSENNHELASSDEGHNWSIENVELHVGDSFKLRLNHDWATSWGYSNLDEASKAYFADTDGGNIVVAEGGFYTISLNYDEGVVSATKTAELPPELPAVSEFVEVAREANSLIYKGDVKSTSINLEYEMEDETTYEYVLGNDKYGTFVKATEFNEYQNIVEYYLQDANANWYALSISEVDGIQAAYTKAHKDMEYGVSIALFNYRVTVFGAIGFLNFIADCYNNHSASTFNFGDASNSFTFKTYYVYDSGMAQYNRIYEIDATFTVNEFGAVVGVDSSYTEYNNPIQDLETSEWNVSTESTPTSEGTVVMTQEAGERTEVAPVSVDDLFYTSYDIFNASFDENYNLVPGEIVNLDEVIQMNNGSQKQFTLGNVQPETANGDIDEFKFEYIVGTEDGLSVNYNSYNGAFYVYPYEVGDYEVKISTANTEKVLKVHVNPAAAESISGNIRFLDGGYYNSAMAEQDDEVEFYVGQEIYITGTILPYAADQTVNAEIIEGADTVSSEIVENWAPNAWSDPVDILKVTAASETTIKVKVSSVATPDVSVTFTIKFVVPPTIDEIVSHDYVQGYSGNVNSKVVFHPNAGDAKTGTVEITTSEWDYSVQPAVKNFTTDVVNYSYDAETMAFVLTTEAGEEYTKCTLAVTSTYKLTLNGQELKVLTDAFYLENTNWSSRIQSIMEGNEDTIGNANWAMEFEQNGKGVLSIRVVDTAWNPLQSLTLNFEYTVDTKDDGSHVLVWSQDTLDQIAAQSEFSNIVISFNADYTEVTVAFTSATYGEISTTVQKSVY